MSVIGEALEWLATPFFPPEARPSDAPHALQRGQEDENMDDTTEERDRGTVGLLQYGCAHYRRRCRLRAPCCGEVFDCRHCHNDAKNTNEKDSEKRHDLPRHLVESVICSVCGTEQRVQQMCQACGVCMGQYFCEKCRFYDDRTEKRQFHCDGCGLCRVGGRDQHFHCQTCGSCYSTVTQDRHRCVENSMRHNCPVCFEYLFDSVKSIAVLPCGHTMHHECWIELQMYSRARCPMCSKSGADMTDMWHILDQEVAATPMPEAYLNKKVWILCNDCERSSEVSFHVVGLKCPMCNSYNTRQRGGPVPPQQ